MVIIQTSPPSIKKYVDTQDSKKVSKAGDTMTGDLAIRKASEPSICEQRTDVDITNTVGTTARTFSLCFRDKNNVNLAWFRSRVLTNGTVTTDMLARNRMSGTNYEGLLGITVDNNNSIYGFAPTPSAKNDNSTKIATTAWVNSASTIVHTTGNETIAGTKTFTSSITSPELKRGFMCSPNTGASTKPYYKIVSMKVPASLFPWKTFCAFIRVSSDWGIAQPSTAVFGVMAESNATIVKTLVMSRLPGAFDPYSKLIVDRFSAIYKSTGEIEIYFKQPVNQEGFYYSLVDAGTRSSSTIPYDNITFYSNPTGVASIPTDGWIAVQCKDYANHLATDTPTNATGKIAASANWVNTKLSTINTNVSGKVSKAGDTMTGDLTLSGAKHVVKQSGDFQQIMLMTDDGLDNTVNPSSNRVQTFLFNDKNGVETGAMEHIKFTDGGNAMQFNARDKAGNWMNQPLLAYKSTVAEYVLAPTPSNKAENSKIIPTTEWVNTASTVVHTTGNETIAGTKTFSSSPIINGISLRTASGWNYQSTVTERKDIGIIQAFNNSGNFICSRSVVNNVIETIMFIDCRNKESRWANLILHNPDSGVPYVSGPTPLAGATGNEIVTASWCNNKFGPKTVFDTNTDGLVPHPTTEGMNKFLRGDGTWATPSTGADANVAQSIITAQGTSTYPILLKKTANATNETKGVNFYSGIYASYTTTNGLALTAPRFIGNLSGTASSASVAGKASNDGDGNDITSTYIAEVGVPTNGTITVTKGNGDSESYVVCDDATTTQAGLMTAADKTKLNGIATGANKYVLPTASSSTLGGVKVGDGLSIASSLLKVNIGAGFGLKLDSGVLKNSWVMEFILKNSSMVSCAKNTQQASYIKIQDTRNTQSCYIMWGHYRADKDNYTITFPVSFSSAWSYSLIATNDDYIYNSSSSEVTIQDRTATNCKIWSKKYEMMWIAVGY